MYQHVKEHRQTTFPFVDSAKLNTKKFQTKKKSCLESLLEFRNYYRNSIMTLCPILALEIQPQRIVAYSCH